MAYIRSFLFVGLLVGAWVFGIHSFMGAVANSGGLASQFDAIEQELTQSNLDQTIGQESETEPTQDVVAESEAEAPTSRSGPAQPETPEEAFWITLKALFTQDEELLFGEATTEQARPQQRTRRNYGRLNGHFKPAPSR